MFAVFDTDDSGTLDINEYMHASSVHDVNSPKEKVQRQIYNNIKVSTYLPCPYHLYSQLSWIFTAFDADGGGSVDIEELK